MAQSNGKKNRLAGYQLAPLDTIYLCIDSIGNVKQSRRMVDECGGSVDDTVEARGQQMAARLEEGLKKEGYQGMAATAMTFRRDYENLLRKNQRLFGEYSGPKSIMPDINMTRRSCDKPRKRDY